MTGVVTYDQVKDLIKEFGFDRDVLGLYYVNDEIRLAVSMLFGHTSCRLLKLGGGFIAPVLDFESKGYDEFVEEFQAHLNIILLDKL